MQFLRDNVFLVGVVAILVIGLAVLLALYLGVSSDYDAALKSRLSLAQEITSAKIKKPDSIVQSVIDAKEEQIKTVRGRANEVMRGPSESRYTVLKVLGEDAFPVGDRYMRSPALSSAFTEAYIEECRRMLATLQPAKLVTRADFDDQVRNARPVVEEWLRTEQEKENATNRATGAGGAVGNPAAPYTPPPMPGGYPGVVGMPPGYYGPNPMMGPMPSGGSNAPRSAEAIAVQNVTALVQNQQAKSGRIYASLSSLDRHWTTPALTAATLPGVKEMWAAQLNLWVQRDIIDAINLVNSTASESSVLHSPVRSLESITVDRVYVASTGSAATGRSPSSPGMSPPGGMYGPPGGPGGMYGPPGGPGGMYGPPGGPGMYPGMGYGPTTPTASPTGPGTPGFTGRASCKEYDVVHYKFTVVMPMNQILNLEKALYSLGFHTVLDVEVASLTTTGTPGSSGYRGPTPSGTNTADAPAVALYYGPGSVSRVTITGELQLPVAFQRGMFDQQQTRWTTEPLVPYEVLADLQTRAADALRPEDAKRITDKNNMQPLPAAAVGPAMNPAMNRP